MSLTDSMTYFRGEIVFPGHLEDMDIDSYIPSFNYLTRVGTIVEVFYG